MSKSVSRVLYQTVIYLGDASPHRSSHLPKKHRANVFFLMRCCSKWGLHEKDNYLPPSKLLPYYSTLAAKMRRFIFCCTILRVASTGSYPAPLPYDARTFLEYFTRPPGYLAYQIKTQKRFFCNKISPIDFKKFVDVGK